MTKTKKISANGKKIIMIKPINNELILRVEYSQDWPMLLSVYPNCRIILEADSFKDDRHTLHVLKYIEKYVEEHDVEFEIR